MTPTPDSSDRTVDRARLVEGCAAIVDVAAPTGYERACAERIVELLRARGIDGRLQVLDDRSAQAWAIIPARTSRPKKAPTVLLYSPIDTVTTGDPHDDVPQAADVIDGHLLPEAVVSADGETLTGLGAQNPKGHAACVLEAAAILADEACPLHGDVIVAFGAGGMPTNPLDHDDRQQTGHGIGASRLVDHLRQLELLPDAAVIAKSGWFVQHEEVGLAWIDVVVRGTHTYVGARHRIPYRNAVADAARVVLALEEHFAETAGERTSETLEPQAMVASLHAGWNRMAAFLPAAARLRADIRLLPDETAEHARARVDAVLEGLRSADPGLDATSQVTLEILGTRTDPDHPICEATRRAWTTVDGTAHVTPERLSGSTDANILRAAGIPTARIGLPKVLVNGAELDFAAGMNTVDARSLSMLSELLVRTVDELHDLTQEVTE